MRRNILIAIMCILLCWGPSIAEEFVDGIEVFTATAITDDLIVKADFADEDWGDMSVSSNSVTLDSDITIGTSGDITGRVAVTSQSAEYNMTAAIQNGGIVLVTVGSVDVNLLVAAAGNSFKVIVRDVSETVSIRPYAGDTIVFPGISPVLDASDELDSPGGAQDELVCQCVVANIWYCNGTSGWTDGGAGS